MLYSYVYTFSPIGKISLTADENHLLYLDFGEKIRGAVEESSIIKEAATQLAAYFIGQRKVFELPLCPGGTLFQQKVWQQLQAIPYGETVSYKQIALAIGNEKACRAVGMANNKNPIPIIIPCHRVIGANGHMVGYAGGLQIKTVLLALEQMNKNRE